jgi:hypothetical protein
MPTCSVSIDAVVLSCVAGPRSGECTIPMPDGSDVATAAVDFAFDAADPTFPAGMTCEQSVGSLVRDGDKLHFDSQIACAADPGDLPSATVTTIPCRVYASLTAYERSGIPGVDDVQSYADLGSCDALANGAPVTCATTPPPLARDTSFSCDLPWQPATLYEFGQRDLLSDGFGRPTHAACALPVANVSLISSGMSVTYGETCTQVQAGSITINGDTGGAVPARPSTFPEVAWSADSGDCQVDSYQLAHGGAPYHTDFVTGTGLTGDVTATTAMGSPIAVHGEADRKIVVLTCTDADGFVSQTFHSVYSSCFGDPLPVCVK